MFVNEDDLGRFVSGFGVVHLDCQMTVSLHTTHVNNREKQPFNGRKEKREKQKEEEGIVYVFIYSLIAVSDVKFDLKSSRHLVPLRKLF